MNNIFNNKKLLASVLTLPVLLISACGDGFVPNDNIKLSSYGYVYQGNLAYANIEIAHVGANRTPTIKKIEIDETMSVADGSKFMYQSISFDDFKKAEKDLPDDYEISFTSEPEGDCVTYFNAHGGIMESRAGFVINKGGTILSNASNFVEDNTQIVVNKEWCEGTKYVGSVPKTRGKWVEGNTKVNLLMTAYMWGSAKSEHSTIPIYDYNSIDAKGGKIYQAGGVLERHLEGSASDITKYKETITSARLYKSTGTDSNKYLNAPFSGKENNIEGWKVGTNKVTNYYLNKTVEEALALPLGTEDSNGTNVTGSTLISEYDYVKLVQDAIKQYSSALHS